MQIQMQMQMQMQMQIELISHFFKIYRIVNQTKGQIISEWLLDVFIWSWTKNERKYFCISTLASKMGQIIKIMAHYHAN